LLHESGELMWLDRVCPWKGHLVKIEEEEKLEGIIKFVFF